MPLSEARIPVKFRGGIDTETDPKEVLPARLIALENGQFDEGGSIGKRRGHDSLGTDLLQAAGSSPVSISGGVALGKRGSELLHFGADTVYSYQDDLGAWKDAGDLESVALTHRAAIGTPSRQLRPGYAAKDGVGVYSWADTGGGLWYSVVDDDTGRILVAPTQLSATGVSAYVYAIGNTIHITYGTTGLDLRCATISPANPLAGVLGDNVLFSDLDGTSEAPSVFADGTVAVFAYWVNGVNQIRIGYIAEDGFVGTPVRGFSSPVLHATAGAVAIGGPTVAYDTSGTGQIMLVYRTSTLVNRAVYSSALALTLADATLYSGTAGRMTSMFQVNNDAAGERRCHVFLENASTSGTVRHMAVSTVGTQSTLATYYGDNLCYRPFARGDYVYLTTQRDSTLWNTHFVRRSDGLIVARFLAGLSEGRPLKEWMRLPNVNGNVVSLPAVWRLRLQSENNDQYTEESIRKVDLDFGAADRAQSVELGESTYVAGAGFLWEYDGEGAVEAGFFYAPDDVTAPTQSIDSGNLATTGVYTYRFAYGWKNARGELEWGPISAGTQVTLTGSNDTLTWAIPTYQHTMKTSPRGEAFIGVFRTENGGSLLYLVSSYNPNDTGDNGYVANDPLAATVSFVDKLSDANLLTREPLYTTGGVLSNDGWENGRVVAVAKNRVFTTDASNGDLVRYSQQHRDLYAVEQPGTLTIRPDAHEGGEITGIGALDDAVIIFRERAIYFVAGPGPLANPSAGGGFTEPQLVTSDVGCSDQRTIATTPVGLVFQSAKGIYLLGRDRQTRYIGAPVEAYNGQTFVSAELIPDRTQVRFLTSSGFSLMWDYRFDQWSTMSNHEGASAVVVGNVYHYLRNDGDTYKESSGYTDGGKRIPLVIETAWLKLAGYLQGFQRIWHALILGEYKSSHVLRLYYQVDYDDGWKGEPFSLDPSAYYDEANYGEGDYGEGPYGGSGDTRYQFRVHIGEKCEAIRFRFEDLETTTFGAAYELSEMLLTGGIKGRDYKVRAERMA